MAASADSAGPDLWCGVFQGGGARGAAYGGALQAVRDHGQWFNAVAGSSAGAITAALVAAGFEPLQIQTVTPALLAAVRPRTRSGRLAETLGLRHLAVYDSTGLESALDAVLRSALGGPADDRPVSFADLYEATGIRLYVIVTDGSAGTPYPFSSETTPDVSVATAVAASCSIPVVFAPRYAVTEAASPGGPAIRQLHDGGLWANFPSFVFTDEAFRGYFGLDPTLDGRVLGFTLIFDAVLPARIDRFVNIPRHRRDLAHQLAQPTPGPPASSRPVQVLAEAVRRAVLPFACFLAAGLLLLFWPGYVETVLPAAVLAVIGVVAVEAFSWQLFRALAPTTPILLGGLFVDFGIRLAVRIGPSALFATVVITAAGAALVALGLALYSVIDRTATGLQGTLRILGGQAIRPVPWVDSLPRSHLIVVPTGDLTVLSFNASARVVSRAMSEARTACQVQLTKILTDQPVTVAQQIIGLLGDRAAGQTGVVTPVDTFPSHRIEPRRTG